ncbi:MAG: ABC transporter permease [Actinomycetota bacterium]
MTSTLTAAGVIYVRNLKRLVRIPILVFFSLFQPLLFLLLFGQIFKRIADLPGFPADSYLAFFAPSVVMLTALNSAFQSGMGTVEDLESGFLDKMLTAPIRRSAVLLGKALSDGTRMTIQAGIVIVVAYLMGFRMETGILGILLSLVVAATFGIAWSGISNIVALRTRNSEVTMILGILVTFPVLFMSTAMMPQFLLPEWLDTVSRWNPASYVIEAIRALANSGFEWREIGEAFGIVAILAMLTFTGAVRLFRRVAV